MFQSFCLNYQPINSDESQGVIRNPSVFFMAIQWAFSGSVQSLGNSLPSSHSVGMQQNRLVGLSEAPMKLATSG
jgi:hypothetical protein